MSAGLRAMCLASVLLHLLGFTAFSLVGGSLWSAVPPARVIPTELLVEPPPAAVSEPVSAPEPEPLPADAAEPPEPEPVAPPPAPLPEPVPPPKLEKVTPPKLVQKPLPERVAPRVKAPPPVRPARRQEPAPASPPPPAEARTPASGNVLGAPAERPPEAAPPPAEGGEAGAGKLFDRGDMGVVPGAGAGGGSGGPGRAGLGMGGVGASGGMLMAGLQPGAGGVGSGDGSGLARPLGGYQVKPRYPESARRQGIAGTTLLKIHVSDRGMVEDVLVERSAGNPDLDLAAMEAVKQWRFEPARQGNRPVAVWVMLPVRFALK